MTDNEFIDKMTEWCEKTNNIWDFTIGNDMSDNTRVTIDDEGFIWIRNFESSKRVKTTINVHTVVGFKRSACGNNRFYVICDDNTGFEVHNNDLFYCIDGLPSGIGNAVKHFEKYPNGHMK